MAKFDELETIEEWKKALEGLLDQAGAAAARGEGLGDFQTDVLAYIKASPAKCNFLDKIAVKAANDLVEQEFTRLIASIAARKQDIETAMKALNSATDGLRKSESDLKFEQIVEALQLSTAIVEEVKQLRADLADEDKANLDKAVAAAKTANDIQKLVKQFEVTEDTLKGLSTEAGTDDATLKRLRAMLGRVIRGEQKFLNLVKATVGSDAAFTALEKPILKHAAV